GRIYTERPSLYKSTVATMASIESPGSHRHIATDYLLSVTRDDEATAYELHFPSSHRLHSLRLRSPVFLRTLQPESLLSSPFEYGSLSYRSDRGHRRLLMQAS
ncbi:hypothetical protein HII31_06486, partial [Pseudocercospora fuligena]